MKKRSASSTAQSGKQVVVRGPVDPFEGSNTDLPSVDQISRDLNYRSAMVDSALEDLEGLIEEVPRLEFEYERKFLLSHLKTDESETVGIRKSKAELDSLSEKKELAMAKAMKQVALLRLESRRSQLSAVQTLASLVKSQLELDTMVKR